ncbi:MAG: tRNA (adenosine(37)-N6)-dimethylallyltransferase MiaA [Solirubrobacteraceae bacterium]
MVPAVIALFGPTGVGKTAVALALADRLRAAGEDPVAVSADALQVYAGLETLTGAASPAQRERLEHRLVGFLSVDRRFSVAEYAGLAHAEIDGLLAAGRRPIVVGGTGLYLRAALAELDLAPPPPPGVRERREAQLAQRGAPALHAELVTADPATAATVDPQDGRRIVRKLELLDAGHGSDPKGSDSSRTGQRDALGSLWTVATRHPTVLAGLTMEREALTARVEARVDAMVAAGAAAEVARADAAGASETARQALGFGELLSGDVEAMKRGTRRLARRQETWMRKLGGVQLIDVTGRDPDDVAGAVGRLAASPPQ